MPAHTILWAVCGAILGSVVMYAFIAFFYCWDPVGYRARLWVMYPLAAAPPSAILGATLAVSWTVGQDGYRIAAGWCSIVGGLLAMATSFLIARWLACQGSRESDWWMFLALSFVPWTGGTVLIALGVVAAGVRVLFTR